ncbi:3-oxo-tetronate kinase [Sodalis sp. RH19]|uniref:3-oxo-tetronate kinase n=1 Tax=unclassified Sodalis (in: enterobacteria) TaxID=2636512 RepID=UPI0039B60521
MTLSLGVIADDFTGATDIASFIALAGWRVVQLNGIPQQPLPLEDVDAVVISLKTRSCPAPEAISQSLAACRWLRVQDCRKIYFKYCSTFDSTPHGNIGPVTDSLLAETGAALAILCPALPVNGRTVIHGYLFVNGRLLNESGMQNHPLTPMTDANLLRVMDAQAAGKTGLLPLATLRRGTRAVRERLEELRREGRRYLVADVLDDADLTLLAQSLPDDLLLTGGSGLAGALAALSPRDGDSAAAQAVPPATGRAVVLSGSCSRMTNTQVDHYRRQAPARAIDVTRCLENGALYARELAQWVMDQPPRPAPMLFATQAADVVRAVQARYGVAATGAAIERLFADIALSLFQQGFGKFIIAGGETSSLITQRLGVSGFAIGRTIAPGVPWVRDIERPLWLALKSGNFGETDFFNQAQELYQ